MKFLREIRRNFLKQQIFLKNLLKIVLCIFAYEYFCVKYSQKFGSEIRTKFTENVGNISGKL